MNLGTVDLAERCKVSPAMVTRFCTKLGFSGFQAMKANGISVRDHVLQQTKTDLTLAKALSIPYRSSARS
ncbi:MAG: hypothetical protein GX986_11795 [Firmicutes bacterium]|nr:hypothetical protein [Bacillota bacterium]